MDPVKKLEDIILKTKIPSWGIGLASVPLIGIPFYAATRSVQGVFDVSNELMAGLLGATSFFGFKWHFDNKKSLDELHINPSSKQLQVKKDKKWYWKLWDSWLLHPKLSGFVSGAALTLGLSAFYGLEHRIDAISEGINRNTVESSLGLYFLDIVGVHAAVCGFFSTTNYHMIKYLSWFLSSEGAPVTAKILKAELSKDEKSSALLAEFFEKHPSRFAGLIVADKELKHGNLDAAADYIKKATKLPPDPYLPNMSESDFIFKHVPNVHGIWKKNKKDVAAAIDLAAYVNEFGNPAGANEILKQTAAACNSAEISAIIAWWSSEAFNMNEEAKFHWRNAFLQMHADPQYKIEPISENVRGVNNVYQIGLNFIKEDAILKEQTPYQVSFESNMLSFVDKIPKDPLNVAPKELTTFSYENETTHHVLVMSYLAGPTLFQKIDDGKASFEDLVRVSEYLAVLHKHVPSEMSNLGTINLKDKLKNVVSNPDLNMQKELQQSTLKHLEFILYELQGLHPVLSQDAHGGQWLFPPNLLVKVDHNDNGKDTLFRDLAKRDIHPRMYNILFRNGSVNKVFYPLQHENYEIYRNKELISMDEERFRLLHLQAMLVQALSFASAWSGEEMQHMRHLRAPALTTAVDVVMDMIRHDQTSHYKANKINYDGVESDFRKQRDFIET